MWSGSAGGRGAGVGGMEGNKGKLTLGELQSFLEKKVCLCSRASALLSQLLRGWSSRDSDSMLNITLPVGKWARVMENSVFLLMKQLKETKYYKERVMRVRNTTLSLLADTGALKWIVIPLAFIYITQGLEARLYISQNHPVKGGDLRIHNKQEEIEARLAACPDPHA